MPTSMSTRSVCCSLLLGLTLAGFGFGCTQDAAASSPTAYWQSLDDLVKTWLQRPLLRKSRVGLVVTTTSGKILYQHQADQLYFPASNTKLITLAASLKQLGSNYRFKTKVYGDQAISAQGLLRGNLYIQGSGDPLLRSEELWRIARDLYNMGLRRISGRVFFDDSIFDNQGFGPGWSHHKHQQDQPYLAPIGGLSLNFNAMGIVIRPGLRAGQKARITTDPSGDYVQRIINQTRTVSDGSFRVKFKILSYRGFREQIVVSGTVPLRAEARTYWRRIHHPGWYTAFALVEMLRQQRIRVNRWPQRRKIPTSALTLYEHQSPSLHSILQYTGKMSSNFATEQLLKTLGVQAEGAPGTWKKGLQVTSKFLQELGISPTQYTMVNGSGLGRINRFSPLQFVTVLRYGYQDFATRPEFVLSQPTAGRDGTLRRRMKQSPTLGRLRAKTGTIDGISTLSGYVATEKQDILIFSFCMNSEHAHVVEIRKKLRRYLQRQTREFRKFQDELSQRLASYPFSFSTH